MLTRFQSSSALAVRPSTGWTRPGVGSRKLEVGSRKLEVGGRAKSAIAGVKNRVKRFLARPGIQKAMSRVGHGLGTSVGMVKGAAGAVRRKAGFKRLHELAEFRRRRGFRPRHPWLCGEERIQEDRRRRR